MGMGRIIAAVRSTGRRVPGPWRGTAVFLAITVVLSALFWIPMVRAGTATGNPNWLLGLMWSPALAAMAVNVGRYRSLRGLGWSVHRPRYLLVGYALPIAYGLVAYGVVWLTRLGRVSLPALSSHLAATFAGFPAERSPWLALLFAGTVGVLISVLSAAGEEIGWRGFLVPELARRTTFTRTALVSGVVWALWHLPLFLFAGYQGGPPLWSALPCFLILTLSLSVVLAWLRLRSGSVWPAVLLHASHNLFILHVFSPLTVGTGVTRYLTGEGGLALAVVGVGLAALVLWRRRDTVPSPRPARSRPEPAAPGARRA